MPGERVGLLFTAEPAPPTAHALALALIASCVHPSDGHRDRQNRYRVAKFRNPILPRCIARIS
jgi:hypothetical protein